MTSVREKLVAHWTDTCPLCLRGPSDWDLENGTEWVLVHYETQWRLPDSDMVYVKCSDDYICDRCVERIWGDE